MTSAVETAALAKAAVREGKKLLARTMNTEEWRMAGHIEVDTTDEEGRWLVSTPPDDPLRLVHLPTGRKLVVPFCSMVSDFASVPEAIQWIAKQSTLFHMRPRDYEYSAYLHDQLYCAGWCYAVHKGHAVRVPVTKRQADAMLFIALECEGATLADGLAYHSAVSCFGGRAWRKCRAATPEWPPLFGKAEK